ncbi:MAG: hypothetical protein GX640_08565 [Fibrobacter sp.]|nr:hypothetical protein [Fibrobacter sp.]
MKAFTFFILALLFTSKIFAQHPDAGNIIFSELNIIYDARSVALGGAAVGVFNGTASALQNPALTAAIQNNQAFIGYRSIQDGLWGSPLGFTHNFKKAGTFTLSIIGATTGKFERIDDDGGNPVFTGDLVSADYLTGALSWAYAISKEISAGLTLKGMYNRLNPSMYSSIYTAKGFAADIGMVYHILRDRFVAALVLRNAGFILSAYDDNFKLPFTVEGGLSFIPEHSPAIRIALDINKRAGDYFNFEPGLEINVYRNALYLRGGLTFSTADVAHIFKVIGGNPDDSYVKSSWNLFSLGTGVNTKINANTLQVDIGFQFFTSLIPPSVVLSSSFDF